MTRHRIRVRSALRRLARAGRVPAPSPPKLSVIVDAHDGHEPFLDDCLKRLRAQRPKAREILVVLHGSDRRTRPVATSHASADERVMLDSRLFPDRRSARTAAARTATGQYVAHVRASDVVPTRGHDRLVRSLDTSGSDLAVGQLSVRRGPSNRSRIDFTRQQGTHRSLSELPDAVSDTFSGNRVVRRDFYNGLLERHPAAGGRDEEFLALLAFTEAVGFDVVPGIAYQRHDRALGVPIGTMTPHMGGLRDWLDLVASQTSALAQLEDPAIDAAFALHLLDGALQPFIEDAERADPDSWNLLRDTAAAWLARTNRETWAAIRAESKVKLYLAADDRRGELEEFLARRWYVKPHVPTVVEDGVVYAELPFFGDADVGVPRDCFIMAEAEVQLSASLRALHWTGAREIVVEGWALIRYVDMVTTPEVGLTLSDGHGNIRRVDTTLTPDPAVTRWAGSRFQQYDAGAFRAVLDANELAVDAGTWSLGLDVSVNGVARRGSFTHIGQQASSSRCASRRIGTFDVRPTIGPGPKVAVQVTRATAALGSLHLEGRTVSGVLAAADEGVTGVLARRGATECRSELEQSSDGPRFALVLPGRTAGDARDPWELVAVTSDGREAALSSAPGCAQSLEDSAGYAFTVAHTAAGSLTLQEIPEAPLVEDVELGQGGLRFALSLPGSTQDDWDVRLESARLLLRPARTWWSDQRWTATFPTTHDSWGLADTPLYSGTYRITACATDASGTTPRTPIIASAALLARLPVHVSGSTFDLTVDAEREGGPLAITVSAPRPDEVASNYGQQQLTQGFLERSPAPEDAVYFQSYDGLVATDSQLAIHEELRRRNTDLALYWGVDDYSTRLPEGAAPLLLHSPEWYERLARVRYLVTNVDLPRWFVKRPHQHFLQTFHGYPSKAMGIGLWEAKRFSPKRVSAELDRTMRTWDLILAPTAEMAAHYRREYAYEGPISSEGYPRNDPLVSVRAPQVRARIRRVLGIDEGQCAVLYAPTWRDDVASGYESARLSPHLDLRAAGDALGDGFVLLVRGHRFHRSSRSRHSDGARIIDVTDYPEVNDLILGADAGLFDYSSIRFDFALTGRPMIFLVPDLQDYTTAGRGLLFDFRESAPGPLVGTTQAVVDHLRNLDDVTHDYRDTYRAFNERFNRHHDGRAAARVVDDFFAEFTG